AGHERDRDPDGAAVSAARRHRRGSGGVSDRFVFAGGRVIDPAAGIDEVRDVVVADGRIAGPEAAEGAERIDAAGLIVAPGLVDLHTHLREPGEEHKET